jgi:hypothetical protein
VFPVFSHNVLAIAISDRRPDRRPITVTLRALRFDSKYLGAQLKLDAREHASTVQTRSHTARTRLIAGEELITLTQEFREGVYLCRSGVAVKFVGASGVAEITSETDIQLRAASGAPSCILIGSSASFDPPSDIAASAMAQIESVISVDPASLKAKSEQWWHRFWQKGSLELRSNDDKAELIQANYHYFLYLNGFYVSREIPGQVQRIALEHWWRLSNVGSAALVDQHQLLL